MRKTASIITTKPIITPQDPLCSKPLRWVSGAKPNMASSKRSETLRINRMGNAPTPVANPVQIVANVTRNPMRSPPPITLVGD